MSFLGWISPEAEAMQTGYLRGVQTVLLSILQVIVIEILDLRPVSDLEMHIVRVSRC
jgi:hypothetical protein